MKNMTLIRKIKVLMHTSQSGQDLCARLRPNMTRSPNPAKEESLDKGQEDRDIE